MNKPIFFVAFFITALLLSGGFKGVLAQSLPSVAVTSDEENRGKGFNQPQNVIVPNTQGTDAFPKMMFGLRNQYFTDITTIQYQIRLLEVLIERQQKNQEIASAYQAIGIPHSEVPPPRGTCEQLPYNKLCAKFYPEIFGLKKPMQVLAQQSQQSLQDFIDGRQPPASTGEDESSRPEKPRKPKGFEPPYEWAEISCAVGVCKAVLVPTKGDDKNRRGVIEGSRLSDGITIVKIGFNEIIAENEKGERKALSPNRAPERGGVISPIFVNSAPITAMGTRSSDDNSSDEQTMPERSSIDPVTTEIDVDQLLNELEETSGSELPEDDFQIIE